jgi:5-formyltetrahydrofolate cyclo-ligase
LQVLEEELPYTHPIDYVATPEELIRCSGEMPHPTGIYWEDLDEAKIAQIPVLQKMRVANRSA